MDKNKLLELSKEHKMEYALCDINNLTITNDSKLIVNDKALYMAQNSFNQLCGFLSIPRKFYNDMKQIDSILLETVVSRLKLAKSTIVKICINDDTILAIVKEKFPIISNKEFIEAVLNIDQLGQTNLRYYHIGPNGVSVTFSDPRKEFIGCKNSSGNDIFRMGLNVLNSQLGAHIPYIQESFERMVCTNLAYASISDHSHAVRIGNNKPGEVLEKFIQKWYLDNSVHTYVRGYINRMRQADASYYECEQAYNHIASIKDPEGKLVISDLQDAIPIHRIATAYGYEYPIDRSDGFKHTARTPINYYDLYNYVTDIGTNCKYLSPIEKGNLMIYGGKMLTKQPDTLDIAPVVEFK